MVMIVGPKNVCCGILIPASSVLVLKGINFHFVLAMLRFHTFPQSHSFSADWKNKVVVCRNHLYIFSTSQPFCLLVFFDIMTNNAYPHKSKSTAKHIVESGVWGLLDVPISNKKMKIVSSVKQFYQTSQGRTMGEIIFEATSKRNQSGAVMGGIEDVTIIGTLVDWKQSLTDFDDKTFFLCIRIHIIHFLPKVTFSRRKLRDLHSDSFRTMLRLCRPLFNLIESFDKSPIVETKQHRFLFPTMDQYLQ